METVTGAPAVNRPLLLLLKDFNASSQHALFDMPVQVRGSVDRRGHVRAPHTRIQKVRGLDFGQSNRAKRPEPAPSSLSPRLQAFIAKHGGTRRLADTLQGMMPTQRDALIASMAKVGGVDDKTVRAALDLHDDAGAKTTAPSVAGKLKELKRLVSGMSAETRRRFEEGASRLGAEHAKVADGLLERVRDPEPEPNNAPVHDEEPAGLEASMNAVRDVLIARYGWKTDGKALAKEFSGVA